MNSQVDRSIDGLTNENVSSIIVNNLTPNEPVLSNSINQLVSGQISLSNPNHVTGTLGISNGGTNSSTALANGKLMISNSGQIIE